jgi:hypothetical protein
MNRAQFANRYTGARVMPFAPAMGSHGPGTCRSCGQPSGQCCCGCRECRKESKELVVEAGEGRQLGNFQTSMASSFFKPSVGLVGAAAGDANAAPAAGTAKAFIGGGCCVHLSIEYAPVVPTAVTMVIVFVHDSEGTTLAWAKQDPAGGHYQIKENIVTTKPGATVTLAVSNATARLRWCEVFSC